MGCFKNLVSSFRCLILCLILPTTQIALAADTGFRSPDITHLPNGWTNRDGAKVFAGTNPASTGTPGAQQGYANFENDASGTFVGTLDSAIPSGSVITGIEVQVRAQVATTGNPPCTVLSHQIDAALSWNNGATYTLFKSQYPLTTAFTYYTLGGMGDTWGRVWSPSEFSNANFVAKVQYTRIPPCAGGMIALDHIQVKVYYEAGCVPTPEICNGLDDDCDGQTDEGNPGGGQACITGNPGICAAGTTSCTNGAIVCNQNQQPTAETCNGLDDNCNGQVDEGSLCDDGNACTTTDTCAAGVCVSGPPPNCDDGNVCTDDSCNPATGCVTSNNTASCSDNNACTTSDTCSGGSCVGGAAPDCNDGNFCTNDTCDAVLGCQNPPNIASCDDANACTTNDTCAAGTCVGGPALTCDDGNVCTDESCIPATGCVSSDNTAPCSDNNACTTNDACSGGSCVGGPAPNCDDLNVCTDDSCAPASGCVNGNNTASCNDSNACTTNDTCSAGSCVGGPAPDCDDGKVCTTDICDSQQGCQHANNTGPCNDGNVCTTGETCQNGICSGGSPPQEVCNGIDDDCDGKTDEGFERRKMHGNGEVWANGTRRYYSAVVKATTRGKDNGEFNYRHPAANITIKAKVIKLIYNCDCEMKFKVRTKHNCEYYVFLDDNGSGGSNDYFGLDYKTTNPGYCPRETTSGPRPLTKGDNSCRPFKDRDEDDDDEGDCEDEGDDDDDEDDDHCRCDH